MEPPIIVATVPHLYNSIFSERKFTVSHFICQKSLKLLSPRRLNILQKL